MPTRAVIAHISDLHYGNHDEDVEGYLRADLLKEPKPDFIVVTGDLSELNLSPQFEKAKEILQGIVSDLAKQNRSARVIVIPGNHDVSVFKQRKAWDQAFLPWEVGGIEGVCQPGKLVGFYEQDSKVDHSTAVRRAEEDWSYCAYYHLEADVLSCRVRKRTKTDVRFENDGPQIVFRRNVNINVPGAKDPIDGAALDAMLTPDEVDFVHNLDFEEINYVGTIDKNLGYCMEITYAGKRLRDELFLNVPMVVVNAPARQGTLKPVVTDLLAKPDKTIEGVKVERHPVNVRKLVIRIPLPTANQDDLFKIGLKVFTPAMMYGINDFDAVGLLRYRHGPKKFSYMLRSEREFIGVRCFAVHRSGLRTLKLSEDRRDNVGWYMVRPIIGSVAALGSGVLCHYHELLPNPTAPALADKTG